VRERATLKVKNESERKYGDSRSTPICGPVTRAYIDRELAGLRSLINTGDPEIAAEWAKFARRVRKSFDQASRR
jgi:hypothetical protein